VLACSVHDPSGLKTGPPLPGELLADLLTVVGEINSVLDPDALLSAIAQRIRRIVDYRILDILLPDAEGFLVPAYVEGYEASEAARVRVRLGEGVTGQAAVEREPIFVPDVSKEPRYISISPGVAAELAIPLLHKERLVGVLNVEGPDVEAFTPAASPSPSRTRPSTGRPGGTPASWRPSTRSAGRRPPSSTSTSCSRGSPRS
jgi:transcriptional regulator with GAF, ATPase, and Fis domain